MENHGQHIVCPDCGAVNRIPAGKDAGAGKCGHCHRPLFGRGPIPATAQSFTKQIQSGDIPVVVDFWASWCGPCRMMAPVFEQMASELEPKFRFLKVDTEAEQGLAAHYNIRSIPTLMVFKNGKVLGQQAGAMDATSLRQWLGRYA